MTEQEILNDLGAALQGKCILVLGPEAHLLDQYPENALPSHWDVIVSNATELKERSVNADDGFFFRSGTTEEWFHEKKTIHKAINNYYGQLKPPSFYDYLASLPFSMIVSLSPDDLMPKVMDRFGFAYDFAYYKKTNGKSQLRLYVQTGQKDGKRIFKNTKELDKLPEPSCPLIFNFLGYFGDSDSILYTYDSLFEFMYDVFPISNIPDDVRNALTKADAYLFIGFGYKYWYLKIIFFLLNKIWKEESIDFRSQAIFNFGEEQNPIVQVYQQVFRMQFFKKPTSEFASQLFSHCAAEGALRSKTAVAGQTRILLLASLPNGKMPIRPDKDWAAIKESMKVQVALGEVRLQEELCSKVEDLLHHLNTYTPNILIISAHGSEDGIFFETETNPEAYELNGDALLDKLNAHRLSPGNQLQIVLLGACHSAVQAAKISPAVDHVIGMNGPIHDESVRLFTEAFLRNYAIATDVVSSVEAGRNRIADDQQYGSEKDLVVYLPRSAKAVSAVAIDVLAGRGTGSINS